MGFIICFSWLKLKLYVFGNQNPKVKCHFFRVISRVPTINMTFTADINLYLSAYWVFVRILYSKVLSSPICFGRKSLCVAHISRVQNYASPHRGDCILYTLIGIFLHGLFVYSLPFIYVSIVYSYQGQTCIFILFFGLSSAATLFTLIFKLLYLWPSGGFSLVPLSILHTFSIVCVYVSMYLLVSHNRDSGLILHVYSCT